MSEVIRVFGPSNDVPTTVHMLVTAKCSLACPGCFYRDKTGEWTRDEATRLLLEMHVMGVKWVAVGGGEPTEWEPLSEFIDVAKDVNVKVAVTTNGHNLLNISPDRVHVSHDKMHAQGDWDKHCDLVLRALEHYRKMGVQRMGINTSVYDALDIREDVLAQVDTVTLVIPKPITTGYNWHAKVHECVDTIRAKVSTNVTVCVDSCLSAMLGGDCMQGRTSMSYDQNGMVSPCSNIQMKPYKVGSLAGAWSRIRCNSDKRPEGCLCT